MSLTCLIMVTQLITKEREINMDVDNFIHQMRTLNGNIRILECLELANELVDKSDKIKKLKKIKESEKVADQERDDV